MSDKDKVFLGAWRLAALRAAKSQPMATVAALMVGGFFIGASQNLMAPNMTSIARSFNLDDRDKDVVLGGWMSSAFFLVGTPMSVAFGVLADRSNRIQLFVLMCAAAAAVNFMTAAALGVYHLLVLRACLGAVYGALNPVIFSMVADLYAADRRAAMASYFSLATGGGTAIGQVTAGLLSSSGWRVPFLVVSAGCAISCGVVLALAVEPARGSAEPAPAKLTPLIGAADEGAEGAADRSAAATPPVVQPALELTPPAQTLSHKKHRNASFNALEVAADSVASQSGSSGSSAATGGGISGSAVHRIKHRHSDLPPGAEAAASDAAQEGGSAAGDAARGAGAGGAPSAAGGSASFGSASSAAAAASAGSPAGAIGAPNGAASLSAREFGSLLGASLLSLRGQLRRVFAVRTNCLVFAQALFGTVPWAVISVYLPDYLAQEQGFSVQGATLLVLLFGLGAVVGGTAGGVAGSRLYRAGPRLVPLAVGCTQALAALPMLWLVNAPLLQPGALAGGVRWAVFPVAVAAGLLASLTGPNLKAIMMNVNPPQRRGAVFTAATLFDSVSKGLAPYVIGVAISRAGSRQLVFSCALLGWVVSGSIIALMTASVARDEARALLRDGSEHHGGGGGSAPSATLQGPAGGGGKAASIGAQAAGAL